MANETVFDCTSCIHREICPAYEVTQIECKNYRPFCNDCEHFMTDALGQQVCNRTFMMFHMGSDDFCSYGERKEG